MMKIFLALFISLAYATEFPEPKDEAIERAPTSRFNQLDPDTFYRVMTFLSAEEVLNLKFLSRGIYRRVRNLWPEMELFTIVDMRYSNPGRSVEFSHKVEIRGMNLKNQNFPYNRAQLSCVQEFTFEGRASRNFQTVINLLPKDSLIRLELLSFGFKYPLIDGIDFPKLIHLKFGYVSMSYDTFSSLPDCMRDLELKGVHMDDIASSLLVTALRAMDKLEILSLSYCTLSKSGFSAILENLPASLKSLDISGIYFPDYGNKSSELGLKRLKEMEYLQEINFIGVNDKIEIILNLPKCITNIRCCVSRETLNVFKQRSDRLMNVKIIDFYFVTSPELYPIIREIFPSLDENIEKGLDGQFINK